MKINAKLRKQIEKIINHEGKYDSYFANPFKDIPKLKKEVEAIPKKERKFKKWVIKEHAKRAAHAVKYGWYSLVVDKKE